jgi:hypothetical protein
MPDLTILHPRVLINTTPDILNSLESLSARGTSVGTALHQSPAVDNATTRARIDFMLQSLDSG